MNPGPVSMQSALLTKAAALFAVRDNALSASLAISASLAFSASPKARRLATRFAVLIAIAGSCVAAPETQKSAARDIDVPIIQAALGTTTQDSVDIDVWNRTLRI